MFQEEVMDIQKLTKKEYDVMYSNNAESEYVRIYDEGVYVDMIRDLLKVADDYKREIEHLKEELEDLQEDIETNYRRIPIGEQVRISDKDFLC